MTESDFIFGCAQLLYYKCHKINFKLGRLYIGSPDWIKRKKVTINDINKKDNQCFQYAITVALNHKEIGKHPGRITTSRPFINEYKWEGINYPSKIRFEKNNLLLPKFCIQKEKYILLMFQNIIQIMKNKLFF